MSPSPQLGADRGPSDADLVRRAQGGDDEAFTALVARHERRVHNLALRMLGREEDALDAAQDAFVSCYRTLGRFRGDAAFTTWLHRIAVNACYDVLRRRARDPIPSESLPEPPAGPDHGDRAADAVDVQRALLTIPPEFRAVLILHDAQGFPYEDVAGVLDIPVGTVKSRLHRGRAALGRALRGGGAPPTLDAPTAPPGEPSTAPPPSNRSEPDDLEHPERP